MKHITLPSPFVVYQMYFNNIRDRDNPNTFTIFYSKSIIIRYSTLTVSLTSVLNDPSRLNLTSGKVILHSHNPFTKEYPKRVPNNFTIYILITFVA